MSDQEHRIALSRPSAPQTVSSRVENWLAWFGLARLVLAAISILVVGGGAYWLLRTPVPPIDSALPTATIASVPTSTLALADASSPSVARADPSIAATSVVVHVAGAVARPGVYDLAPSARVVDAITAAGGATPEADTDRVNLAAPVADGERIYLPTIGEPAPPDVSAQSTTSGSPGKVATPSAPLDINRATAAELEQLPGIGPATAAAIVDDRQRNGPYASVDDLDRVSGIGPAKLAALADLVTV